VFVYGRDAFAATGNVGRQTRQASEAIARRHKLTASRTLFLQQSPDAIAAGVFHNDVIAVATGSILFCHQRAFLDQAAQIAQLRACVGPTFTPFVVADADVALEQAVSTYVFNSQLLTRHDGRVLMVAPVECATDPCVAAYLARLTRDGGPIAEIRTFDLRQSMRNGGGPACLRLCVPMTPNERAAVAGNVWLDQAMYDALHGWVQRHYRDRLAQQDLADPSLLDESRRALDELSRVLQLGNIYAFQRVLQ
jgi:succinylarginine dihydrolase